MVSARNDNFEIVFGNHRVEACKRLGWKEIPAIVRQASTEEGLILQIVENIQRNTIVNSVEEARAYKFLLNKGMTIQEIANKIGKSYQYVWSRMRLVDKLHPQILEGLEKNKFRRLNTSHAEQLSMLGDQARQLELARIIEERNLSLKQLERIMYADTFSKTSDRINESSPLLVWTKDQDYFLEKDRACLITGETLNIVTDHLGRKSRAIGRMAGRSKRRRIVDLAGPTTPRMDWMLRCFNDVGGWGKVSIEGSRLVLTNSIIRNSTFILGYLEGYFGIRLKPLGTLSTSDPIIAAEILSSPCGEVV
jgi:ParB/RepB/Spo0J family partition protein